MSTFSSLRSLLNFHTIANLIPSSRNFHAHHLFDETFHTNLYSLNSLLTSHVRDAKDFTAAWSLFHQMHRRRDCFNLNSFTFTPVLAACSALPGSERGKLLHGLTIKTGADSGTVVKTAIMDMYSKCGNFDNSVRVFEEIQSKDVVSWNALLSTFLRQGLAEQAFGVFEAMKIEGVELSEFTLCSLLKACASLKAFRQGKQVHGLVVVMAMGPDIVVLATALVDFYSTFGYISEAMKVYSSINYKRDHILVNSLISGCVRNQKYVEAFSIMCTMKPNIIALTSALAACSEILDLWIGKQIHCVAIRQRFTSDTQLCNVLLDMYSKCGKLTNARFLFNGIGHKDIISWTSMIQAYGSHGDGHKAFELFKMMGDEKTRLYPNSVTILAVLSACGHSGLVDQGKECFNLAVEKYGLDLGPEHYACFVDILGRAGQMDEVWVLFHDMEKRGTRPTAVVWAALLNACRHNLDVTRGVIAAKNLLQLEPSNPGNYVLVSNFYASVGKWESVDELREIMRKNGLFKEAGSSWVTVFRCYKDDTPKLSVRKFSQGLSS